MTEDSRVYVCRIRDAVLLAMNHEAGEICEEYGNDAVAADVGVSALMSALASIVSSKVSTADGRATTWDLIASQALDQACRSRGLTPSNRPN